MTRRRKGGSSDRRRRLLLNAKRRAARVRAKEQDAIYPPRWHPSPTDLEQGRRHSWR